MPRRYSNSARISQRKLKLVMIRLHETAIIVPLGAAAPAGFRRYPRLSAGPRAKPVSGNQTETYVHEEIFRHSRVGARLLRGRGPGGVDAGHQGSLVWREGRTSECHRFKTRLLLCNDDASCKFSCDGTSACGDPAPGKEKVCNIVYTCSDKPDARVEKSFPDSKTPQELSCE
jgi:hypothetical protein